VKVGILLPCGKHLSDHIMSLRGEVWTHSPSSFYGSASTTSGKWAVVYLFAWGIGVASFYILSVGFWNCSDSVIFFIFRIIAQYAIISSNRCFYY